VYNYNKIRLKITAEGEILKENTNKNRAKDKKIKVEGKPALKQNSAKKKVNEKGQSQKAQKVSAKKEGVKTKGKVKASSDKLNAVVQKSLKPEKKVLKIRFIGGVGEIGKNMTAIEYGKDIIVIDAGLTFPSENMPGVDLVIPDSSYLEQNKSKIKGIVITHGHEDHIGGLPYLLKEINAPVFGTKLTLTLIENKLKEHKLSSVSLNCVKAGSTIKLGCFSIEFINVNHSIAGAVGLSISTPVGVIFHSGDFKIDFSPVNGETMDLKRIAEIGNKGVLLMMADSTNIEFDGMTISESAVKDTLDHVFSSNSKRRIIIATFASNVHRLQQILDLAVKHKRKVAFSGRSMINIAEAASKIGELSIPENLIVDIDKTKNFRDEELLIVSTGTQGEPMSALTRMASGEFNKVVIGSNDTVIISASVIPGNEKMIYGVINNLYKLGAEVIYESLEPIHASGHACRGELKILHSLVKPKFFIPVHGEYRHLKKHALLAQSLGMKEYCTLIAEIGDTVCLSEKSMSFGEKFVGGARYVDGSGIDEANSFVIRDRIRLSEEGILVVSVGIEEYSKTLSAVEIVSKGLNLTENLIKEAKAHVINVLTNTDLRKLKDKEELSLLIIKSVKNYVYKTTGKSPIILPVTMVV